MNIQTSTQQYFKYALILAGITIGYNIIEGLICVYFGFEDETLALFGFGIDSFVEVISGVGIFHMVMRIKNKGVQHKDHFEKTALKITAIAFYILTASLVISSIYKLIIGAIPESTFWGLIISLISLVTMGVLIYFKFKVGKVLKSDAIIADAKCTMTCFYLSVILLASSALFYFFQISWADSIGALGIAVFSLKEGKESWGKAKNRKISDCCRKSF